MKPNYNLHQKVTLHGKVYKIIGIDAYFLKNLLGKNQDWTSYTLLAEDGNKTWVSYVKNKAQFIEWSIITEKEFKKITKVPLNLELSGLTQITFKGLQGFSTPQAEILWFDIENQKFNYITIERFFEYQEQNIKHTATYYYGGTIVNSFKP